jgi:hypothetical protein
MSNSDKHITITKKEAGLTELPVDTEGWSNAEGIFLQENMITELNADLLPRELLFLDLTKNPITRVIGTLPPGLISLVLTDTKIEKLGLLPESLTELVITETPMATKYGITSDITDKDTIKRLSNIHFTSGTIMVDNTPARRHVESNSENNSLVNENYERGSLSKPAYNSDDTRHLVMILDRIEDEKDIKYRVQTLNEGEKFIFKQHLEPYEPSHAELIEPVPLTNPSAVYTKEGHGEDILFEHPVPPGCIYVTIEECGILSSNWGKLLFAFEDKPEGIRDMLRDPIRFKKELMAHFGRSFHIHYPEAEKKGDRTYVDCIHYPFLAWDREETKIGKSGILSLDDNNVFVDESIPGDGPYDEEQVLKVVDSNKITDEDLHKLLDGSRFPTYQMVKDDLAYLDDKITYSDLKKVMDRYAFTQSWSFKMFPGIHYNFSCRDIAKHPQNNLRIGRRRANSLEGRFNNINAMTNDDIQGSIGFNILAGYVDAGVIPMVTKMIEMGVDVNQRMADGNTLLATSAAKFKKPVVEELLKVPGIDRTGAVEAVEASVTKLINKARTDEQKAVFRKNADDMIALITGPPAEAGGSRHRKRKTRVRSRRLRRTRRKRN